MPQRAVTVIPGRSIASSAASPRLYQSFGTRGGPLTTIRPHDLLGDRYRVASRHVLQVACAEGVGRHTEAAAENRVLADAILLLLLDRQLVLRDRQIGVVDPG